MRGRLAEVPQSPEDTEIDTIRDAASRSSARACCRPRRYANLDNAAFLQLDLSKNLYPFGKEPKVDCILYLACDELLQTAGRVHLARDAARRLDDHPAAEPERPARARVGVLGRQALASPRPLRSARRAAWRRRRARLSRRYQGDVAVRHGELPPAQGHGQRSRSTASPRSWIRVRIEKGDYGEQGQYTLENEKWLFKDDRPLQAARAAVDHVPLSRGLSRRPPRAVVQRLPVHRLSPRSRAPSSRSSSRSRPSPRSRRRSTSASSRSRRTIRLGIYFQLDEELGLGSLPTDEAEVATAELDKYETLRRLAWEGGQRVVWEYFDGRDWEPLAVDDETQGFTSSGFAFVVALRRLAALVEVHRGAVLDARAARAGRLRQAAAGQA